MLTPIVRDTHTQFQPTTRPPLIPTPTTGYMIAIEGNDGCGKSTQIPILMDWLREEYPDRQIAYVKCPSMESGAGVLRKLVLGERVGVEQFFHDTPDPLTQRWILFAEWLWTYQREVLPLLSQNAIVVLDRSHFLSNFVYGIGQGIDETLVERVIGEQFIHTRHPDLAIVLDVEVDVAQKRIAARVSNKIGEVANHFDLADVETFALRRSLYLSLLTRWDWVEAVSASGSVDEVSARICALVALKLAE